MCNKGEDGFTLVEVIVSLSLLGIIALSIIPAIYFSLNQTNSNEIKINSLNLAYGQLNWIRSLHYNDIGICRNGHSTEGIIEPNLYMNRDDTNPYVIKNIKYTISTNISYIEKDKNGKKVLDKNIKRIDIIVKALNPWTGVEKEYSVINTTITFEGEKYYTPPGHLKVIVYDINNNGKPVRNVEIKVNKGNTLFKSGTTNGDGEFMFSIDSGEYSIIPKYQNKMFMPNGVVEDGTSWRINREISAPKWDVDNPLSLPDIEFYMDFPGRLILENQKYNDYNISINPIEIDDEQFTLNTKLSNINNIVFWRYWKYEYTIENNNNQYFLAKDNTAWEGNFEILNNEESKEEFNGLVFGLEPEGIIEKNWDKIYIKIKFTSKPATNNIEIKLNNLEQPINNMEVKEDNTVIIEMSDSIPAGEIELEITNPDEIQDVNGITLALNKNKAVLMPEGIGEDAEQ